jgi:hypothetical protein
MNVKVTISKTATGSGQLEPVPNTYRAKTPHGMIRLIAKIDRPEIQMQNR